jgi:hypothetical protein
LPGFFPFGQSYIFGVLPFPGKGERFIAVLKGRIFSKGLFQFSWNLKDFVPFGFNFLSGLLVFYGFFQDPPAAIYASTRATVFMGSGFECLAYSVL